MASTQHAQRALRPAWFLGRSERWSCPVLGGDGGVHFSVDEGATWVQGVLPIAQFYEVSVDDMEPDRVYGGMQDTASWTGPSRTYDNEGITDHDWLKLRWVGDGMAIVPDPRNANVIYMAQNNGNTSRLDLRTRAHRNAADATERQGPWPQPTPLGLVTAVDPRCEQPRHPVCGSQYVFRCEILKVTPDGYADHRCAPISGDLSRQQNRPFPAIGEGYHSYGALFSLAQSTVDPNAPGRGRRWLDTRVTRPR